MAKKDLPLGFESLERADTLLDGVSDLTLLVLKAHLLIEEELYNQLRQLFPNPQHYDLLNLRFVQNIWLARALCVRRTDDGKPIEHVERVLARTFGWLRASNETMCVTPLGLLLQADLRHEGDPALHLGGVMLGKFLPSHPVSSTPAPASFKVGTFGSECTLYSKTSGNRFQSAHFVRGSSGNRRRTLFSPAPRAFALPLQAAAPPTLTAW